MRPPTQRDYAAQLAALGGRAASSDVAAATGRTVTSASRLRGQLLDRGILHAPEHGQVEFTIPGFADWIVSIP